MRRRDLLCVLGGTAAGWPLGTYAQQGERIRRIGVLLGRSEIDPEFQIRTLAFRQELQKLGWIEGRNVSIEIRSLGADGALAARTNAAELVASSPDVIVAGAGSPGVIAFQQATQSIPVVFVGVVDPVGVGVVASLARPGGNITGFMPFEYGISAKWLELLREIDPRVKRAGVLRDPSNPTGIGFLAAMQSVAPMLGTELITLNVQKAEDIERSITDFARAANGGLVVTNTGITITHRALIAALSVRHRLTAIYPSRAFAAAGGLISYGPNTTEPYRLTAGYVDRILRGEKPYDLPVQAPAKFELIINMKTAKALGLDVPLILQQRADEVIE